MFVIMMWLIVRLLCELCIMRRCCFLVVIIVDDDLMTLLVMMTCCMYGCKCLIRQWWVLVKILYG